MDEYSYQQDWQPTKAGLFAPSSFVKVVDLLRKLYELDEEFFNRCERDINKLAELGAVDLNKIKIVLGDYRDADLSGFDIVYMCWTPFKRPQPGGKISGNPGDKRKSRS